MVATEWTSWQMVSHNIFYSLTLDYAVIPDLVGNDEGQNVHLNFVAFEKKADIFLSDLNDWNEYFSSMKKWDGHNRVNQLTNAFKQYFLFLDLRLCCDPRLSCGRAKMNNK